jgi:hypothetical protein
VFERIFAVGVVCKTEADEEKSVVSIHIMTSILATNLSLLLTSL